MNGYYEYATFKSPYQEPQSTYFFKWLEDKYKNEGWELVCPVNCYVANGNSVDDYIYIFRKWIELVEPNYSNNVTL